MRAGMGIKAAGAIAAVLFLAGCATPQTGGGAGPEAPAAGAVENAGDIASTPPSEVAERLKLPSCGEIELDQGESLPDTAVACMDGAGAEGAELIVTAPSVEGESIVSYYRALPGGGVEIFVDATLDTFAGPGAGWAVTNCPDAASALATDLGECTSRDLL